MNWAWEASLRDRPGPSMHRHTNHTAFAGSKAARGNELQNIDLGWTEQGDLVAAKALLSGTGGSGVLDGTFHDSRDPMGLMKTNHSRTSGKQASSSEGHVSRRLEFAQDDVSTGNGKPELNSKNVVDSQPVLCL